jgi:hypothetical protein
MQPVWTAGNQAGDYPGKLQAVSIIQTVAGGLEILAGLFGVVYVLVIGLLTVGIGLLFIPIPLIVLTVGILSLMSGIRGLKHDFSRKLAFGVAIAQMVLLLGCDFIGFGCGLAGVILLTQDDSKAYFAKTGQL